MHEQLACTQRDVELPLDGSNRNRPESVDGVPLEWDARGNLKRKGDLRFVYDARDRLLEVRDGADATVASYEYDGLNRRVLRSFGGRTWRTVWSDWQPIEEYEVLADGTERLMSRRVYGAGLDEMALYEYRLTPSDSLLTAYTPIYDAVGNLAVMLDADGKPVERYDYSPYGKRYIWTDSTPPAVEQIRLEDGVVIVELSEEIREDLLYSTLNNELKLTNLSQDGSSIPLGFDVPVTQGRRARHRLKLTLSASSLPEEGDLLRLQIPSAGLEDLFGNRAVSVPSPVEFTWSSSEPDVIIDQTPPRLLEACVKEGKLHLVFSEPPAPANLDAELPVDDLPVTVDGAAVTWTVLPDGYTLEHVLTPGAHTVTFAAKPLDLVGKPFASAPEPLSIPDTGDRQLLSVPYPGEVGASVIGNPFGFHGLPVDEETGLIYVRNRYYDPEMGRFLQTDPHGYADSANLYQFALNDPVNNSDPTGRCVVDYGWDVASLGLGAWSFSHNVDEGNFGAAVWDAVGITVDSVALAVPCLPGGVGAATKVVRGAQALIGAGDVGQALYQGAVAVGQEEYHAASLNLTLGGVGGYLGLRGLRTGLSRLATTPSETGSRGLPVRTGIRAGGLSGGGSGLGGFTPSEADDLVRVFRIQEQRSSSIVTGGVFATLRARGRNLVRANRERLRLLRRVNSSDPKIARNALSQAQGGARSSPFISTTFDEAGARAVLQARRARGHDVELLTIVGPRRGGVDFEEAFRSLGGRTKRFVDAELQEFGIPDLFIPAQGASHSGFVIVGRE